MALIFIGGVNGSGKSTLIKELQKGCSFAHFENGSTLLMRELQLRPGDYASLRALPDAVKESALTTMFEHLAQHHTDAVLVLAGHYVKVLNGIVSPSYGPWYGFCSDLILVTADVTSIIERIGEDERNGVRTGRQLFSTQQQERQERVRLLREAQSLSQELITKASTEFGVPRFVVANEQNMLARTIQEVGAIIERRRNAFVH